jgi:hypothetical protein
VDVLKTKSTELYIHNTLVYDVKNWLPNRDKKWLMVAVRALRNLMLTDQLKY